MLTVEIKINGLKVAAAHVRDLSALDDISDYDVTWAEGGSPDLGVPGAEGRFHIAAHRRRQTVWALAAKVVQGILGQMVDRMERGR